MNESLINIAGAGAKQTRYAELVSRRKSCNQCSEVVNPSTCAAGKFDDNGHIGPWTDWQGNLESEVIVVGQEWGGTDNYSRQLGRDLDGDPTNLNLVTLMQSAGLQLSRPSATQGKQSSGTHFFTNAVLCLRNGAATNSAGKANSISEKTFSICARRFLREQIELVEPRFVFVLGKLPWNGLMAAYSLPTSANLKDALEHGPIRLNRKTLAFPLYHCGSKSNINRKLPVQLDDWKRMRDIMDKHTA